MQRGSENRLLQNGTDKFMKGAMTQLPATAGDHTYWPNKALCRPSQAPSFQVKRTLCYSAGNQMPVMSALPCIHRDKHDVHKHSTFPKPPCCKADCGLSKPTFLCQTYCGLYFRLFFFLFTHCLRQEHLRELERPLRVYLNCSEDWKRENGIQRFLQGFEGALEWSR